MAGADSRFTPLAGFWTQPASSTPLRHDAVVSKTAAGEWALAEGLCPDPQALELALSVRREPALIRQEAVLRQAELLTPAIQRFAAVLQRELEARRIPIPN